VTEFLPDLSFFVRTILIASVALAAHLAVHLVRKLGERLTGSEVTASICALRPSTRELTDHPSGRSC
jgi:hypothetical protein